MKQFRQGDILIQEVSDFIGNRVVKKYNDNPVGIVLAYGEATGHSHLLKGNALIFENESGMKFLEVKDKGYLVHDEHKEIVIPEGKYAIIRQRVYTPKEIQYVRD